MKSLMRGAEIFRTSERWLRFHPGKNRAFLRMEENWSVQGWETMARPQMTTKLWPTTSKAASPELSIKLGQWLPVSYYSPFSSSGPTRESQIYSQSNHIWCLLLVNSPPAPWGQPPPIKAHLCPPFRPFWSLNEMKNGLSSQNDQSPLA